MNENIIKLNNPLNFTLFESKRHTIEMTSPVSPNNERIALKNCQNSAKFTGN